MNQDKQDYFAKDPRPYNPATGAHQPGIEPVVSPPAEKPVRVIHGAFDQPLDNLHGQTVGFVKRTLRDVANIPFDAEALVVDPATGRQKSVGDDYVIASGDKIEFYKEAGIKGLAHS